MQDTASCCTFQHPGMGALDQPVFRLTEGDRVAALAIRLDGSEAVVPLPAVAKLFGIPSDSPDGEMLRLITQSLRFVSCLRLGDALPPEVLTGDASWQPSVYHRQIASARLQLQLLNWITGGADGQQITSQMLVASVDDPAIRPRVQEALRKAADELGISGGGPAVAGLIEEMAVELAYIEALRERLLVRVQTMVRRLIRMGQEGSGIQPARRETLAQVTHLATNGLGQISSRFDQVDAQTGEIMPALRNLEQQRTFLRPNRDWLYCTQVAWEPTLKAWESLPPSAPFERVCKVLEKMYRFLAPRYMPVQEWQHVLGSITSSEKARAAQVW